MKEERAALARSGADPDATEILSPAVGRYFDPPPVGTWLQAGSPVGILRILAKAVHLTAPEGVAGIVAEVLARAPAVVDYGLPILRVTRGAPLAGAAGIAAPAVAAAREDVPEGMLAVRSPTDGIFYRRPSPEDPAYVSDGDVIEAGRVVGLVEVMKCFNQITWKPGPGGPPTAKVARVLVGDSAEVKLDQPLVLLEPAD